MTFSSVSGDFLFAEGEGGPREPVSCPSPGTRGAGAGMSMSCSGQ